MFYFFSKTLNYLITPAGWLVVTLLVAFFTKNAIRRRRFIGVALGVFWICGNGFLTNELALWWEYPPAGKPADSTATVAVLLTGGMINVMKAVPSQGPADRRYVLDREADRAGQALYLYKTGAVRKILISGGNGDLPMQASNVSDEGQMTASFLLTAGVPPTDIVFENRSRNTHENAAFTAPVLRNKFGTTKCVLVTSAWHMRRAVACFEKAGVTVVAFPGGYLSGKRSFVPGEWLLPNEQAFADAYFLLKELAGYVVYKLVGYA
ncbi:YdcF family protein [Spirosoma fluminis]